MREYTPDDLTIVYHSAAMGNWQEVVSEQFASLRSVGLSTVHGTHVGNGVSWLKAEAERQGITLILEQSDPNISHYETFAILFIERECKQSDKPILYFHTKGVSAPGYPGKLQWRRVMQENVVERWRDNLVHLETHDLVGFNWHDAPGGHPHFSGNFWLARAEWLRKEEPFHIFHTNMGFSRVSCEFWIGWHPSPRVKSLVCRNQPTWDPGFKWEHLSEPEPETPHSTNLGGNGFLFVKGSKFGDILWASVVIRAWSKLIGRPIDFMCSETCDSIVPLLEHQSYIGKAFSNKNWPETGIGWPQSMSVVFNQYKQVRLGTYRKLADRQLPQFIAKMAGMPGILEHIQGSWIKPHGQWKSDNPSYVAYAFNDISKEAKDSFIQSIKSRLPDLEFKDVSAHPWLLASDMIAGAKAFIGCRSANYVLAHALHHPKIIVYEPVQARQADIFGCPFNTEIKAFDGNIDEVVRILSE